MDRPNASLNKTVNLIDSDLSTKSNTAKKSSRTPTTTVSDKKSSRDDTNNRAESVDVSKRLS